MEQELDPYEKQLLAEFESCDQDHEGSLDCNGLQQLCEKLQLADHGQELMEYIVGSKFTNPIKRISFQEFRDGLLAFLRESQNEMQLSKERASGRGSPDREVSPKFVFGKKKYGRRSRPESSEFDYQDDVFEDSDLELVVSVDGEKTEIFMGSRHEQTEENVHQDKILNVENKSSAERNPSIHPELRGAVNSNCQPSQGQLRHGEEEGLRSACERLGVGRGGFLDSEELLLVCQAVGMENVAKEVVRQLFEKLNVDSNGRISFEEFLLLLRGGESWPHSAANSEAASTPSNSSKIKQYQEHSDCPKQRESLCSAGDKDSQFLDLSMVDADAIVEMWEAARVPGASRLLQDLGFSDASQVSVSELAAVLDEELRHLGTERQSEGLAALCSPQEMLLQATLCLYQAQVRCLKSCVEHMSAERDKLRADLVDANERASLLAQEVDDHHARLEESTQLQVRMLEQRHAQLTKELTEQLTVEREQLALQNAAAEQQLSHLQDEEARLHAELTASTSENESLERENQNLLEQLSDAHSQLQKQVESLEALQQWVSELEGRQQQEQVVPLLEKVHQLEAENIQLRDQCDELSIKCETFTALLASKSSKCVGGQTGGDGDLAEETGGGGTKRRGASPGELPCTSAALVDADTTNPRMGKIRRCSPPIASGQLQRVCDGSVEEAGLAVEGAHLKISSRRDVNSAEKGSDTNEVEKLHVRISFLEHELERMTNSSRDMKEVACPTSNAEKENSTESSAQFFKGQLKQVFEIIRQQILRELQEDNIIISSLPQRGQRMQKKIVHEICNDESRNANDIKTLEKHCNDLRCDLEQVKTEILKILSEKTACSRENCALKRCISELGSKLCIDVGLAEGRGMCSDVGLAEGRGMCSDVGLAEGRGMCSDVGSEGAEVVAGCPGTLVVDGEASGGGTDRLESRCRDLERSLELLRQEYEECEEYWAGKLDEERKLFEQEQAVSDRKFAELLAKIQEYEEVCGGRNCEDCSEDSDDRLSTIEERASLEKQVTDLEEECEDLKLRAAQEQTRRAEELAKLRQQLDMLERRRAADSTQDVSVQVSDLENCSWESNHMFVVELDSARISSLNNKVGGSKHRLKDPCRELPNGYGSSSSYDRDVQQVLELREQLEEECQALAKKKDTLVEELMVLEHNIISCSRKRPKLRARLCQIDLSLLQALSRRLRQQEQQCRHLHGCLKKQQQDSKALLKRSWQQHEEELAGLRAVLHSTQEKLRHETQKLMERLLEADILVRDLYVENAYLAASVQRLEQRCHVFVQMSADSSSV